MINIDDKDIKQETSKFLLAKEKLFRFQTWQKVVALVFAIIFILSGFIFIYLKYIYEYSYPVPRVNFCETDSDCILIAGCGCQIKDTKCNVPENVVISPLDPRKYKCVCENGDCISQEKEEIKTDDWQSYQTVTGSFAFKYPLEWELKVDIHSTPSMEEFKITESYWLVPDIPTSLDEALISVLIYVFNSPLETIKSFILDSLQEIEMEVLEVQDIEINGVKGLHYVTEISQEVLDAIRDFSELPQRTEYYLFYNKDYAIFFGLPGIQEEMMYNMINTLEIIDGEREVVKSVFLSGKVVDSQTQEPIPNTLVKVIQQWVTGSSFRVDLGGAPPNIYEETQTDKNGKYDLEIPIYESMNLESHFSVTACKENFFCDNKDIEFGLSTKKILNFALKPSETINLIANYMGGGRIRLGDDERAKIDVKSLIITNDKDDSIWNDLKPYENMSYELLMFEGNYYATDKNIGYIELDYVSNLLDRQENNDNLIMFEKDEGWGPCPPDYICRQLTQLYYSGDLVLEGEIDTIRQLSREEVEAVKSQIELSGIMQKDCNATIPPDYWKRYTLNLDGAEKRISSGCENELKSIEDLVNS